VTGFALYLCRNHKNDRPRSATPPDHFRVFCVFRGQFPQKVAFRSAETSRQPSPMFFRRAEGVNPPRPLYLSSRPRLWIFTSRVFISAGSRRTARLWGRRPLAPNLCVLCALCLKKTHLSPHHLAIPRNHFRVFRVFRGQFPQKVAFRSAETSRQPFSMFFRRAEGVNPPRPLYLSRRPRLWIFTSRVFISAGSRRTARPTFPTPTQPFPCVSCISWIIPHFSPHEFTAQTPPTKSSKIAPDFRDGRHPRLPPSPRRTTTPSRCHGDIYYFGEL
jgi:hypothetical protein